MNKHVGMVAIAAIAAMAAPAARATTERPATDETAGGACRASTSDGGIVLGSRFWNTGTDTIETPYGRSAVIVGELTTGLGAPLANATLSVEEFLIGAGGDVGDRVAVPRVGAARTAADGSYAFRMPAGPNREAIFAYRGQVMCSLRYLSAARPTLNVSPGRTGNRGRAVRFWGRLPGPYARSRVVVLQAQVGSRWRAFRYATTDRRGRFHSKYRFTRTFHPTAYSFRALVPRQAGYPWMRGASRLVSVSVYP